MIVERYSKQILEYMQTVDRLIQINGVGFSGSGYRDEASSQKVLNGANKDNTLSFLDV